MENQEKYDHGDDLGPAFHARRSRIMSIGAVSVGSTVRGRVIEVRRMSDTIVIDRMWGAGQLSDRQHSALSILFAVFVMAGLSPRTTSRMDNEICDALTDMPETHASKRRNPIELEEGETYLDRYRRIMRDFKGRMGEIVDGMMLDQHPGCKWLATAQSAADRLADQFGLERVGV